MYFYNQSYGILFGKDAPLRGAHLSLYQLLDTPASYKKGITKKVRHKKALPLHQFWVRYAAVCLYGIITVILAITATSDLV